jgi:hypothetical protein
MQALLINLFTNSERTAIILVCLLSAGFMIWFLIALAADGRRTRARRSFPLERITIQRHR